MSYVNKNNNEESKLIVGWFQNCGSNYKNQHNSRDQYFFAFYMHYVLILF